MCNVCSRHSLVSPTKHVPRVRSRSEASNSTRHTGAHPNTSMFRIPLVAFATQCSVTHPPSMGVAVPSAHPMIVIVVPLWPCHGSYRREIQVFDKMLRCNQKSQALCSPTRAKMDQDVLSSEKQKPKKMCDVCAKKNNEESHG